MRPAAGSAGPPDAQSAFASEGHRWYYAGMDGDLHIGTCSWKYASWRGLVYSDAPHPNYLAEYARHYDTVEVDQWFWSLFGNNHFEGCAPLTLKRILARLGETA